MEQNFFRETAERYCTLFQNIAKCSVVKEMSLDIDSNDFDDKYRDKEDVRYAAPFKQMFSDLTEVDDMPCLYRWEITSPYNANEIKQAIESLRKYTPRVLKNAETDDDTLYVGKVQSHIVGRVIQHLGYHLNQASHGLQLSDWAKPMNLKFKLHIIVLPKEKDIIDVEEIFENEFAKKHKPLIGMH